MIGSELRKSRSPFDHKPVNVIHTSVPKGLCNNNYKNFDDPITPVKNFDTRNCNPVSSQSPAPPLPPLRGSSSLLASRYVSLVGHEKYPSWPSSCDPSPCLSSNAKSWSVEEPLQNNNYSKDRLSAKQQISQLKTVIEKCEQPSSVDIFETKVINDEARSREKVYMHHLECERIFADDDDNAPCPPDRDISLAKSPHHMNNSFHQYSHSHQDSSYMSQDGDYAECYVDEGRTLLTKAELEQYTKDYEENIIKGSHQKQPSYAQSEGYHSYVSSNDSAIITPLLDRLRRENDVIVSVEENTIADRESNASSGSSSDTLKWHGSLSDVSVASSSYRGNNSQHIVHSARVQTPQRHHSESVLYLGTAAATAAAAAAAAATAAAGGTPSQQQPPSPSWQEKVQKNNQMNSQMRKLFPVNTYSVQPQQPVSFSNTTNLNDNSPTSPKLTVAERISALERQNQNQNSLLTKYIYFDPEKKHKVSGQDLKVMQKKALLLYYERHHSSWRSEPQLSPIPSPPQPPPPRPRLPTPTSRRSSSASDYQDSTNKENSSSCNIDGDVTNGSPCPSESRVHSQYSSSCGSLSTPEVGPVIIGDPISVDDWVPELPPKKAHLRASYASRHIPSPDLPPPSPPPVVDDEVFISDEPLPPPPPEIIHSTPPSKNKGASRPVPPGVDVTRSPAPSLMLPSTTTVDVPSPEIDDKNCKISLNARLNINRLIRNSSPDDKNVNKRAPSKSKNAEFLRYSQHLYKEEVSTAEYKNQSEPEIIATHQRAKETFFRSSPATKENVRTQNTEFLAKRSVFTDGYAERESIRYSSTQKLQINGKLTSVASCGSQNGPNTNAFQYNFESKLKKVDSKNSQFSSCVQRHSEKFPLKLDPHCPPTTYQLSQSSYRREPRDREKGLPNFEGSYKRTMSPSPSCTNLTNGFINGTTHINCAKDIENLDPKTRTLADTLSVSSNHFETSHHYSSAVPHTSQSTYRDRNDRVVHENSHREPLTCSPTPSCEYAPKTLPKSRDADLEMTVAVAAPTPSAVSNGGEPKQRSSRTPRTQSDPSSVKDTSASSANLLSSQSSSSSLNLQKSGGAESPLCAVVGIPRSQSDLSNVGSTESGYSSLSLNVPSPSVSPTRLSSSSSSSSSTMTTATGERGSSTVATTTSWSCTGIQCDMQCKVEASEDDSFKYPQKSEIVLRISATTSDAASQTDTFVSGDARSEQKANAAVTEGSSSSSQDRSTSPIFKQKSQEEIDCEELSRDLISHLSVNDHLYKILAPKPNVKKSMDYLTNLFRTTILPFSDYSSSVKQSEDTRLQDRSVADNEFSYLPETGSRLQQKEICDNTKNIQPLNVYQLQQKKEKLINRLDHRINILKVEQAAIVEECRMNESLGDVISEKVAKLVSAHEAAKYKLHIQEIGHITSLLLGLSGRLAKVENSLQELSNESPHDKKTLENKRDKLICQLEEAKALKKNIDKRSCAVSSLLVKHFSDEEIAEYEYFVHKKSKLLMDSREISEKIQNAEQQLNVLKDAISDQ